MRTAILTLLLVFTAAAWAVEPVELEGGRSPDGKFFIRFQPPVNGNADLGPVIYWEVCRVEGGAVVGKRNASSYAPFPMVAEAGNTAVLWSPDSKHLALMT